MAYNMLGWELPKKEPMIAATIEVYRPYPGWGGD